MADSTMAINPDVVASAYNAEAELSEKLSRREMRRMGLTVLNASDGHRW